MIRFEQQDQVSEAELAMIGAAIARPSIIDRVAPLPEPTDFHNSELGRLWGALLLLHRGGEPIDDPGQLKIGLTRLGIPWDAGTLAVAIRDSVPLNAPRYAARILRAAGGREIDRIARKAIQSLEEVDCDPMAIAQELATDALRVEVRGLTQAVSIGDAQRAAVADLQARLKHGEHGMMLGIEPLDRQIGGLYKGEVAILAARPGVGKSALSWQMCEHVASKGRQVLFISLEMSAAELANRRLCRETGRNSQRVRSGMVTEDDVLDMRAVAEDTDLPIWIYDRGNVTVEQIAGLAKLHRTTHGLHLIVVDYLQLIRPSDSKKPRYDQVSDISSSLKQLAKLLNVPLLCCCQLNRQADGQEPRLSHLRDSGQIEQDADVVMFLHPNEREKTEVKLIVAKHRHAQCGAITLEWNARSTSFAERVAQASYDFDP